MSAIGPGDWVQALPPCTTLTAHAIYQVAKVNGLRLCAFSDDVEHNGLVLVGWPRHYSFCICGFRPWPGEPDATLLAEPADHDVREPA